MRRNKKDNRFGWIYYFDEIEQVGDDLDEDSMGNEVNFKERKVGQKSGRETSQEDYR